MIVMDITKYIRHGDLILKRIDSIPKEATKTDNMTLALGEATGHDHTLQGNCQVYEQSGTKFVKAEEKTVLTHQEHNTVKIDNGLYRVDVEQEFDPFEKIIQKVRD